MEVTLKKLVTISANMITIAIKVFPHLAPLVHLCKLKVQPVLMSASNAHPAKSVQHFLLVFRTAQKATIAM